MFTVPLDIGFRTEVSLSHNPSLIKLSRISQLNMPGFTFLYSSILDSISGVDTLGLLPPTTPGLMLPVSWYLFRIFDTQPCETLSCLEMTHGLMPAAAIP